MKASKLAYRIASEIQKTIKTEGFVCVEEPEPANLQIIPEILTKRCRQYVRKIVREINGTYEQGYFSACAVMIRRLIETCMIEAFEKKGLSHLIKEDTEYKTADLIKNELLQNPFNNLSRNARRALQNKNLLGLGHQCAHDRFFTAGKGDIDDIRSDVRILIEYLIHQFS